MIKNVLFVSINLCLVLVGKAQVNSYEKTLQQYQIAQRMKVSEPDSAAQLFGSCKREFLSEGDTLNAIKSLVEMASIYTSSANYSNAYDGLWEAKILATAIADSSKTGEIYDYIGLLYSLFGRNKLALRYLNQALEIKKQRLTEERIRFNELVSTYYLFAIYYRERHDYGVAQHYLDSCKLLKRRFTQQNAESLFVRAEQAYLYHLTGKTEQAEKELRELEKGFREQSTSYLVILYAFMGDVYRAQRKLVESEMAYLKSLYIAGQYKSHQNFVPTVYEQLSKLYYDTQRHKQAFDALSKAKELNERLFGAKSEGNHRLLEIKDEFRLVQEKQRQLLARSKLTDLEQVNRIRLLQNLILLVSLALLALLSLGTFLYFRSRFRAEKRMAHERETLTETKNQEILEIKNKELTSSALQLIEKDELLLEMKNLLENHKNTGKPLPTESLLSLIKTNSRQDWSEFNARFTSVNEKFYASLQQKFPDLTQSELKLCALIKLNFSSKEMVSLLGISIESVHTARYRLRKKLGLERRDNLVEFIARV